MIDVDIKHEEGFFKLRVCGVIRRDNKILTLKASAFDGYCFPGGHVELGELSSNAVVREMKEELGVDIEVNNLICVNENVFINVKGTISHEIVYYYDVNPLKELPDDNFIIEEMDKGKLKKHNFCWLCVDELEKYKLMPPIMGDLLKKKVVNAVVALDQISR